jgi:putative SOS response-associated peptidase YedK
MFINYDTSSNDGSYLIGMGFNAHPSEISVIGVNAWQGIEGRMTPASAVLPSLPGVFPDYPAPVVRNAGADRELTMMRWGMPPPLRNGGLPATNIRNTASPHWRGWLKPESRCLVPANSLAEYAPEPNPETKKKDVVWFALNEDRPLFAFAGIWTEFRVTGAPSPSRSPALTSSMAF